MTACINVFSRLGMTLALAGLCLASAAHSMPLKPLDAFDSDTYLSCAAMALAALTSLNTAAGVPVPADQPEQAGAARQLLPQLTALARDRQRIDPSVPFDELHQFLAGACYARSRT